MPRTIHLFWLKATWVVVAIIFPFLLSGQTKVGFNIRDFGALGDAVTIDSDAINQAIDKAAEAGGGTVYFPAGTYASYSIRLKSNVALFLDQGATILAAKPTDSLGYDAAEPFEGKRYQDFGHSHWHNSLIWGENLENISIFGPGTIDGSGLTRGKPKTPNGGNKAIALKLCRNVTLKDFTIVWGGHFGILATGVDNLTIDNLRIDTNRDGIDIDCCKNVRVSNCTINSQWDDALCLKSSYALGYARPTENVTITNCQVTGYDRGTLIDGTYQRNEGHLVPDKEGPTGRIKFGTESNGGFKGITITNCVFEYCRGLALETVDGGILEDVVISNLVMRDIVNSPFFLRFGARMRGPENTEVGKLRRVTISNVQVYNADSRFSSIISGIPGHPIQDISLHNVSIGYKPLDPEVDTIPKTVPEYEDSYPEPQKFGIIPSYGFFIRHVEGIELRDVKVYTMGEELRPAVILDDVEEVRFINVDLEKGFGGRLQLVNTKNLDLINCPGMKNKQIKYAEKLEIN